MFGDGYEKFVFVWERLEEKEIVAGYYYLDRTDLPIYLSLSIAMKTLGPSEPVYFAIYNILQAI